MRTILLIVLMPVNLQAGSGAPVALKTERPPSLSLSFDSDPVGKLPAGWLVKHTGETKTPAVWQVVADDTAPSRPNVLALTKTESADAVYNLLILDESSFKDIDLSVKVKGVGGKVDQGGGVLWRCQDENNYYLCRLNPLESNFRVYKVENGKRTQFATVKVDAEQGRWYTLRVTMTGPDIACYLDGEKLLEAKDDTFPNAGMIGLWTKADAATAFDDLRVKEDTPR